MSEKFLLTTIFNNLFFIFLILFPCCFICNSPSFSQESANDLTELQKKATKVFIDVDKRYQEYIKTEIPFVNYVRDRKEAQVHILLTHTVFYGLSQFHQLSYNQFLQQFQKTAVHFSCYAG